MKRQFFIFYFVKTTKLFWDLYKKNLLIENLILILRTSKIKIKNLSIFAETYKMTN